MSHITDVKLRVRDLDALSEAAERLGLTLRREQKTHAWYGRFVGDSRPPAGRDPQEYGRCEHAIRSQAHAVGDYEIGVVRALDGDGFDLLVDTWGPGRKLADLAGGESMNGLRREYAAAVALKRAKATLGRKGFVATREDLDGGRIRLRMVKR